MNDMSRLERGATEVKVGHDLVVGDETHVVEPLYHPVHLLVTSVEIKRRVTRLGFI